MQYQYHHACLVKIKILAKYSSSLPSLQVHYHSLPLRFLLLLICETATKSSENSFAQILRKCFYLLYNICWYSYYLFFSDKVTVAGQQTALDLSTMAIVNMDPMSPKTSWISQTTPPRRPSDNLSLKVCQNLLLTLHILAPQPLIVALVPHVARTNRMRLFLLVEKGASQVCPAWRS